MALASLLASMLLAAGAFLLATAGHPGPQRPARRWARRFRYACRSALAAFAGTGCVGAVLATERRARVSDLLRARLAKAGLILSRSESAAMLLLLWAASALAGIVLAGSGWGAIVGSTAFAMGVLAYASRAKRAAEQALASEMPAVFRSLAVSLGSGLTLAQAIAYVGSREESVAAPAFLRCSLRILCGDPYDEALALLGSELDTPGVGLLSSALAISHRTGSPLQGLFMRSAGLVERAGELERMLVVKTAQVRLSVRIVCLLPALLVGVLLMISPDFQAGIATPSGTISLLLAFCMDLAAVLIVRRLSKGVV